MDVDIDITPSFKPTSLFKSWTRAMVLREGKATPHNVGVYPQRMAKDPLTGLAAIPYQEAEDLGYLKVDFLPLHVYKHFKTRAEIEELLKKEPDWNLMLMPSTHGKLFQLSKHSELIMDVKPKSLMEVADLMALIRPAKKHFVNLYKKHPVECRKVLYAPDETGYSFKKSHALAYSYVIWLQLHLIEMGRL